MNKNLLPNAVAPTDGYLDAPRLLENLFPNEACRPSLRWLREMQKKRKLPFIKLGRLVFFDPCRVREVIGK